ncbi:hypothetical protein [Actinoplanes aureus]|uniref:Uncharacterized protein n=1 Tax=Actinoplanes aureus TaxID=2792083 RepID=A0A931G2N3_9ACTN|nr:hypothetical protein [Actinoplanes aureus]MBG0567912.1 hypothetical protein [Actinoplanes aureus]
MANGLFNRAPVGAVAIVEPPVSQWYARRARVAFIGVSLGCWAVATMVLSASTPLWIAVLLGLAAGLVVGLVAALLVRVWPVLRALWWWSLEIATAAVVVAGLSLLARVWSWRLALAALLLVVIAGLLADPVRRFVWAWSWCAVDRHRLRLYFAGLARASGGSRAGLLPLMLWARPTPAGERVWLWLRPGLELADLDGKAGRIAVTCWAKQVRVVAASERHAALVRVDIGRRDSLAGRIDSPLALLIPSLRLKLTDAPVSPAMPPVGLNLADIPDPPAPEPRNGRR